MEKDSEPPLLNFQRAVLEGVYNSILDEIIDDAILDLCFEVHRAVKLGYYFTDVAEMQTPKCDDGKKESKDVDIFGEVPSKMKFSIFCPQCQKKLEATRFATHLDKCMGMGRQSSRVASQKCAASIDALDSDYDDDYENGTDFSYNSNKKRTKKKQGKNSARRFPKKQGIMMGQADSTSVPQDMSYEEKTSFLNQNCGVISKHTGRMCTKTLKCSQHTDEQKRDVRRTLLERGCIADQFADDVQIDVDTVDEDNSHRFWDQPISRSPSPSECMSPASLKREEKKAIIIGRNTAAYFHKKKSLGTNNSVIEFNESSSAGSSFDAL